MRELRRKLCAHGYGQDAVDPLVDQLVVEGLLSDQRFAENLARSRVEHGYGPLRIRRDLLQRGVDRATAAACLEAYRDDWPRLIREARRKRFGQRTPGDARERLRQGRFLEYRGFAPEEIRRELREDEVDP